MKTSQIKAKVAAKVAKGKSKIAAKCGKAAKACAVVVVALLATSMICGCTTAEAPTAQRAQNVTAENVNITYNITVNANDPVAASNMTGQVVATADNPATADKPATINITITTEAGTATQSNETSGTEGMTNTPTQTPTTDVKPQTTFTYGLCSGTAAGTDWIQDLTAASAKGLSSWLRSGNANGKLTVTKRDGSTETVTCKDGTCTTSCGACITCSPCSEGSCSE